VVIEGLACARGLLGQGLTEPGSTAGSWEPSLGEGPEEGSQCLSKTGFIKWGAVLLKKPETIRRVHVIGHPFYKAAGGTRETSVEPKK
jgi:hypothetical protein